MLAAACVAAGASVVSVAFAWWNRKKVIEVHALVNERLTTALGRIEDLNREIGGHDPPKAD